MPKFSIIIPTYNRADFISRTIESVLNQTFQDFEVLIVDDGSTDQTNNVVNSFKDSRVKYYFKTNEERGAARNFGIGMSIGSIITFLDSDDILYPNHLQVANEFSIINPNLVFWQGYDICNENDTLIQEHKNKKGTILENLISDGNLMACMGVFLPRNIILENRFIEDRALAGSEDMELWIRIASKHSISKINKATSALIDHDARSVINIEFEKLKERKLLMLKYVFDSEEAIIHKYKNRLKANAYSYIALHGVLVNDKRSKESFKFLLKSIRVWPKVIFKKRTWAIFKRLF